VISHPIQHFAPVYLELASRNNIGLRVFYGSDAGARSFHDRGFGRDVQWDIDLLSGYNSVILTPGAPVGGAHSRRLNSPRLTEELNRYDPDVVLLYGYASRMQWRAWNWARMQRKGILYFSDTNVIQNRSFARRMLKRIALKVYFGRVSVFLAVGDRNIDYLLQYGASPERIIRCPLTVDIGRFRQVLEGDWQERRQGIRRQRFGLPAGSGFVVGFAGKMTSIKRPRDVLEAVCRLKGQGRVVQALMVGSGPLLEDMKRYAEQGGIAAQISWTGFINQSEIPTMYASCDALVLSSDRDNHPLAVTEAAACGLPVIVSDRAGCVGPTDTARHGENAIVYPCGDVKALAAAITRLMDDPVEYARMAQRSLEIAETQDVPVAAQAIEQAVLTARICRT